VFAACLPGAAVLVVAWARRRRSAPWLERPLARGLGIVARRDGESGTHV
jgi:hypothetical protein